MFPLNYRISKVAKADWFVPRYSGQVTRAPLPHVAVQKQFSEALYVICVRAQSNIILTAKSTG